MFDRIRQRIEARDLPFVGGNWSAHHGGLALGRLARRSPWLQDFLNAANSRAAGYGE